jgi:hypothetical protein
VDRLTSKYHLPTHHAFPTSSSSSSSSCPFKMYTPTRGLDFGNKTYAPQGPGYCIERMGPASVQPSLLSETPKYVGTFQG